MRAALFADTFYWIALIGHADASHERVMALTVEQADFPIVTTDEVLIECLTFFGNGPEQIRQKAV